MIPEPLFLKREHGHSLQDEAVEWHDDLVSKTRLRHSRLYERPDLGNWLSHKHGCKQVTEPSAMVSWPEQYRPVDVEALAFLAFGEVSTWTPDRILRGITSGFSTRTSEASSMS